MTLTLYDTRTARKCAFEPKHPNKVGMYVCGVTVYDYVHIGHARCYTVFDVLVRYLRESGYEVTYVRNITDIDDKIINRAEETGEPPLQLAKRFTDAFHEDMSLLGVGKADVEPRVSDHIPHIIRLIQKLVDREMAYPSEGDVYFRVRKFPGYGKLSHRDLSSLALGASGRLDGFDAQRKQDPEDFALWKSAKPGELSWESPWGHGRPGWHIECSAMSMHYLGETLDIHGGGLDLVFPHHENEIAQSEAATSKPFAGTWIHNGFVEVAKEKMSKSLGNFFTVRECFQFFEPEALRYFVLTVHYRAPLNLDFLLDDQGHVKAFPLIEEAERRVEYIYNTRLRLEGIPPKKVTDDQQIPKEFTDYPIQLKRALDDDLNMPVALAVTGEFLKQVNEVAEKVCRKKGGISRSALDAANSGFALLGRVLGLGEDDPEGFLQRVRLRRLKALGIAESEIQDAIEQRSAARRNRDFKTADAIRSRLAAKGVELMDGPEGTTWHIP